MERTAIPGLAHGNAARLSAGRLRELRRWLVSLALVRFVAERWTEAATYVASSVGAVVFARFALLRHERFQSEAYDLGFFDQVVWNTAQGHFFQTSFEPYNFLGVHFQPVLLLFAALYRLGAGIESLLIVQAMLVGAASVPLYYATRRLTGSGVAGLATSLAFLLTTSLHNALDFDFHPEMLGFFFVFLALYYLAADRPRATVVSLLPLLALKEDMPLVLVAFAVLLFVDGHRRHARNLFAVAVGWTVAIPFIAMSLIRWGDAGLAARYGYLIEGSSAVSLVPHIVSRGTDHLESALSRSLQHLLPTLGLAILAPVTAIFVVPPVIFHGLSKLDAQAHLDMHYVMMPLALSFVGGAIALRNLARGVGVARLLRHVGSPRSRAAVGAGVMLVVTMFMFWTSSPYSPAGARGSPSAEHIAVVEEALRLIPEDAPVAAQSTIFPHLSQRRSVFRFPLVQEADYAIIDANLNISSHEREDGYDEAARNLPGFTQIFDSDGVRVFRRLP